jgi:hypothetical protein
MVYALGNGLMTMAILATLYYRYYMSTPVMIMMENAILWYQDLYRYRDLYQYHYRYQDL